MNKKTKILFFHNSLPEYRLGWFKVLNDISEIKFIITNEKLAIINYGFTVDKNRTEGLDIRFLTKKNAIRQMYRILQEIPQYDFVELPPIDSFFDYVISLLILYKCKKSKVSIGYFWEKWEAPIDKQPFKRKLKNFILRIVPYSIYSNVDLLFSPGEKSKDYFLKNGISEDKIKLIPNSSEVLKCEQEDIRKIYNIPDSNKIILFLGRVIHQKGIDILIESYLKLKKNLRDNTTLIIAGDGEFLEYCKSEYSSNNIIYTGSIKPDERYNFYSQCDIFVYPVTYREGWVDVWGLTLNEALQFNKFIIATNAVGSAFDLIREGKNGYIVEPENVTDLSEKLFKALCLVDKSDLIKESSKLKKIYNYKNMGVQYLAHVNKLLDN